MRNHSIDVLKFICAMLVVFIHAPFYGKQWIEPITRCAVPIFFMISGFMLYNPDKEKMERHILKSIKKIAIIILWSSLLYYLYRAASREGNHSPHINLSQIILYNINPLRGHLWYLNAYEYVLLIVYSISRLIPHKLMSIAIPISMFLLILNLGLGKYAFLFSQTFPLELSRNFLFCGLPFFTLGMFIKKNERAIQRFHNISKYAFIISLLFAMLSVLGKNIIQSNAGDLYISSIFLAISLFITSITFTLPKENFLTQIGKEDSLYIYIFHPMIMDIMWIIIARFECQYLSIVYGALCGFIVFIVTVLTIRSFRGIVRIKKNH